MSQLNSESQKSRCTWYFPSFSASRQAQQMAYAEKLAAMSSANDVDSIESPLTSVNMR
jgi:hypothetical protein